MRLRTTRVVWGALAGSIVLAGCAEPVPVLSRLTASDAMHLVAPGERTECFDVTAALRSPRASVIAPRLDPSVAHHVALHRATRAPVDHDCPSMGRTTLLYMGSPGDDPLVVPDDHALVLSRSERDVIVLELHYVNASGEPRADASGLDVISASPSASRELGLWTVGDPVLAIPARSRGHVEQHDCTIRAERSVTLHAVSPHMHGRGVALSVTRTRGELEDSLVAIEPFDPDRQVTISLEQPLSLEPGDRIALRCVYDNLDAFEVGYGTRLEDEMCFAYFWASPIDALLDDASFCH